MLHFEQLLRDLAPQVLGAIVRRYSDFHTAEDAVQEALLAASTQWPTEGPPNNPQAWLIQVAARRMTDQIRTDAARLIRRLLDDGIWCGWVIHLKGGCAGLVLNFRRGRK